MKYMSLTMDIFKENVKVAVFKTPLRQQAVLLKIISSCASKIRPVWCKTIQEKQIKPAKYIFAASLFPYCCAHEALWGSFSALGLIVGALLWAVHFGTVVWDSHSGARGGKLEGNTLLTMRKSNGNQYIRNK